MLKYPNIWLEPKMMAHWLKYEPWNEGPTHSACKIRISYEWKLEEVHLRLPTHTLIAVKKVPGLYTAIYTLIRLNGRLSVFPHKNCLGLGQYISCGRAYAHPAFRRDPSYLQAHPQSVCGAVSECIYSTSEISPWINNGKWLKTGDTHGLPFWV